MATRARLGYVLSDDSIVSVYHHWDGYPEWLGVTLNAVSYTHLTLPTTLVV